MRISAAFLLLAILPSLNSQQPPASQSNQPNSYDCHKTAHPPKIDGNLNDPAWKSAPWTSDFIDIAAGAPGNTTKPPFHTRAKLLWDDQYLYIAADLEEPDIHSTMTEHDSSLYKQNNFEWFLKPFPDQTGYFEFEINARGTTWDLYLPKTYADGGKADSSWEVTGIKQAIQLHGTLNNPKDHDHGWTVELAVPWTSLATRLPVTTPTIGTEWRANLMRVEWPSTQPGSPYPAPADPTSQPADPAKHPENYSVWTPQGIPDIHHPEHWGYLHFVGN